VAFVESRSTQVPGIKAPARLDGWKDATGKAGGTGNDRRHWTLATTRPGAHAADSPRRRGPGRGLRDVVDPRLGVNVVDLGIIYGVTLGEDKTRGTIDMTLTSAAGRLTDVNSRTGPGSDLDRWSGDFKNQRCAPVGPERSPDDGREQLRASASTYEPLSPSRPRPLPQAGAGPCEAPPRLRFLSATVRPDGSPQGRSGHCGVEVQFRGMRLHGWRRCMANRVRQRRWPAAAGPAAPRRPARPGTGAGQNGERQRPDMRKTASRPGSR